MDPTERFVNAKNKYVSPDEKRKIIEEYGGNLIESKKEAEKRYNQRYRRKIIISSGEYTSSPGEKVSIGGSEEITCPRSVITEFSSTNIIEAHDEKLIRMLEKIIKGERILVT